MLAMKAVGIMPNPLDTREIFFTNLLLLGFDPAAMESREKILFNRDMFALPNKKAMEIVMHFLFSKLSPQMTYEEFRDCWPVKNKAEEQQFRKTCYNWVSRISKEEIDTNFPRVVQSLFHSPGGDRFYNFLLLFSIYVLKVVMLRDHSRHVSIPPFPSKSIHNHNFTQVISKSYQVQTGMHRKRFFELTKYSLEVQHHWKAFSVELTKENRSLKKKIRELERQIKGEVKYKGEQMAKSLAVNHEYQKEAAAIKRTQQLQKVRGLWRGVEDFYSVHSPQRVVVDTVLEGQANKHQLDATDVQIKIPDLLLREFERDLHIKRIGNTYVGGKLNLLSLIQLWNLSLNLVKDKIRQDSVPSFDESSPKIKNDVHTHQSLLANAETLRSTLSKETIPDLKQSVEKLKSRIYQDMAEQRGISGPHPYSFNLGLGLAPATPPVSFTAAETPASHRISSFQDSLKRSPVGVSTPEVINSWSESLRGGKPQVRHPVQINDYVKISKGKTMAMPSQIPKPEDTLNGIEKSHLKRRQVNKGLPNKGVSAFAKKQFTPAANNQRVAPSNSLMSGMKTKSLSRTEPRKRASKGDSKRLDGDLDSKRTSAANTVANQIIGILSSDRPNSASGSSSQSSSRASTPKPQAIEDPMEALDETAFVSRDLILRTPAPKEKYAPSPAKPSSTHNHNGGGVDIDDDETLKESLQKSTDTCTKSLDRSGRLLGTILNQTNEPLTAAKVKTALFSPSPEDTASSPFTKMLQVAHLNKESPMSQPVNENMLDKRELLLSPFVFETPKPSHSPVEGEQDDLLELHEPKLLTFSFGSPLSQADQRGNDNPNLGLSPFLCNTPQKNNQGPMTETCGTPSKINGTNTIEREIPFTPSAASDFIHKDSPLMLSDALEEKLRLSNGKLSSQTESPEQNFTASSFAASIVQLGHGASQSIDTKHAKSQLDVENKRTPQISLFKPTIEHNGGDFVFSEDEVSHPLEKPNSAFGGLKMSDEEDTVEQKTPVKESAVMESNYKEMKDSDLMNRLNRIKQAQRYDFVYLSPGNSSTKTIQEATGKEENRTFSDTVLRNVAIETLGVKRLTQIQEVQQGQQVTPGADTQVILETNFRGMENPLLTPLTASSRGSPEHISSTTNFPLENKKAIAMETTETASERSTPTSMLSEKFFLKSPFGNEKDDYLSDPPLHRVFTLDSPIASPDMGHNGFSQNLHTSLKPKPLSSPDGTPDYGTRLGKRYDDTISKDFSTIQLSSSDQNGITDFRESNRTTPKGFSMSSDRRLSYDDFLNESVDPSFLVQNTPFSARVPKSLHGAIPSTVDSGTSLTPARSGSLSIRATEEPDSGGDQVIRATIRSPAVGQLIDL